MQLLSKVFSVKMVYRQLITIILSIYKNFSLRAGGHNGIELGILRETVNKRNGHISEEQKALAGIGVGHIGKLVGADTQLLRQNLPVSLCL